MDEPAWSARSSSSRGSTTGITRTSLPAATISRPVPRRVRDRPRGPAAPAALKQWRAGVTGIRLRRCGKGRTPDPAPGWPRKRRCRFGGDRRDRTRLPAPCTGRRSCRACTRSSGDSVDAGRDRSPQQPRPAGRSRPADFRALLDLARFPNVFVKLSGFHHWCTDRYPYPSALPYVEAAVNAFGAERCMWGRISRMSSQVAATCEIETCCRGRPGSSPRTSSTRSWRTAQRNLVPVVVGRATGCGGP